MPTVTVELEEGEKTFETTSGTRLVLALEDNGIDISHRCGGFAHCTTCRCKVLEGEPDQMTEAEQERLEQDEELGNFRLSCQIKVDHDLVVRPLMRVKDMGWDDAGDRPQDQITPEPVWTVSPLSSTSS